MRGHDGLLLEVDLTTDVPDGPVDPLRRLAGSHLRLDQVVDRLHAAARDDDVVGVVAHCGATPLGLAAAQEIREALAAVAALGKPLVGWAETFGELTPATSGYYLASVCPSLWLQPSGMVGLHGITLSVPFLRGMLDRLGMQPQLLARHEYKNAPDSLTRTGFSEAHEEAVRGLVEALSAVLLGGITDSRGLSPRAVTELMAESPVPAERARSAGLVDHLGYRHHAYASVLDQLRSTGVADPQRLVLARYHPGGRPASTRRSARRVASTMRRRGDAVAVMHLSGPIHTGHHGRLSVGNDVGSTSVSGMLARLGEDERVGALVVRVDSPGGSYVASDAIWEAVRSFRGTGRPVVASMGAIAASGGYYVSMAADHVVAAPATVTGSIGVFAGKVVVRDTLSRLGIEIGAAAGGPRAQMSSALHPYSPSELEALQTWLDAVYEDFVEKVARSRHLSHEHVDRVARGRVWSGHEAQRHGLVDDLGGLRLALGRARGLAGLPSSAPIITVAPSPWRELRGPQNADDSGLRWSASTHAWGPFGGIAAHLGLPPSGPLTCPVAIPPA